MTLLTCIILGQIIDVGPFRGYKSSGPGRAPQFGLAAVCCPNRKRSKAILEAVCHCLFTSLFPAKSYTSECWFC